MPGTLLAQKTDMVPALSLVGEEKYIITQIFTYKLW